MKNFTKFLIPFMCGAAVIITSRTHAFQDTSELCNAVEVVTTTQGLRSNGSPVAADRSNPNSALGTPDKSNASGGFYSLGINGTITLKFGGAVFNQPGVDIMVYETSYSGDNCGYSDDETALIELSQHGDVWVEYGVVC